MTRDMDLFRAILLEVESQPAGKMWSAVPLLEHPTIEVVAHVRLISDAGLVDARFISPVNNEDAFVIRITNDGYDFLEASRQPSFWEKAKERVKSAGVPISVYALKQVFDILIKEHLAH
jgi:hypothetical protein